MREKSWSNESKSKTKIYAEIRRKTKINNTNWYNLMKYCFFVTGCPSVHLKHSFINNLLHRCLEVSKNVFFCVSN